MKRQEIKGDIVNRKKKLEKDTETDCVCSLINCDHV